MVEEGIQQQLHTSSSDEIRPRLTRRTLAQLRTNKSPFLKSYLHKVDAKTHPSPLCPLCNIHTSSLQLHPHTHHIVAPGFVDRTCRSDCTAGQMDGEAGWWTTSGNIPPLARVMGVGRQQQTIGFLLSKVTAMWYGVKGLAKIQVYNVNCITPSQSFHTLVEKS